MFKNVLLGFDGSEHALRAAHLAGDLCRLHNSNLRIVVAYDPIPPYLGEPNLQQAIAVRMKDAEEIMRAAVNIVKDVPGAFTTDYIEGSAAEALLSVAAAREIDLIIMGSRGLGGLGSLAGLLLGSQSQKVVSHAACPVLIVR